MHPQLQAVVKQYEAAQHRLHQLATRVPAESWNSRPRPNRWSIAECIEHLNITSRAFAPIIQDALDRVHKLGPSQTRQYRRDFTGWFLWKNSGPPVRMRIKTPAAFVPTQTSSRDALISEFDRLQADQIAFVGAGDGYPIHRVKIISPFDARFQYNLYSCFTILPRHQHRHLWQAEQISA